MVSNLRESIRWKERAEASCLRLKMPHGYDGSHSAVCYRKCGVNFGYGHGGIWSRYKS